MTGTHWVLSYWHFFSKGTPWFFGGGVAAQDGEGLAFPSLTISSLKRGSGSCTGWGGACLFTPYHILSQTGFPWFQPGVCLTPSLVSKTLDFPKWLSLVTWQGLEMNTGVQFIVLFWILLHSFGWCVCQTASLSMQSLQDCSIFRCWL